MSWHCGKDKEPEVLITQTIFAFFSPFPENLNFILEKVEGLLLLND